MKKPRRLFRREQPDDEDRPPRGTLQRHLFDKRVHEEIRRADVVLGIQPDTPRGPMPLTPEEAVDFEAEGLVGIFYGIAAFRRIVRRDVTETLRIMKVPVDPDTDDIEVLCVMVEKIKGACCYGA